MAYVALLIMLAATIPLALLLRRLLPVKQTAVEAICDALNMTALGWAAATIMTVLAGGAT